MGVVTLAEFFHIYPTFGIDKWLKLGAPLKADGHHQVEGEPGGHFPRHRYV
jgi:hypothetical protein